MATTKLGNTKSAFKQTRALYGKEDGIQAHNDFVDIAQKS